ncbi:MAG: RdgB/HAM1 family non-canonical purine NTP pyrophosphatase [Ruminococcaceae bacterium]|nr:RdgB/HAM1 family non-canonical purine NTP pyrophosphatase [Oscillospiraceae bacterium]
MNQIILASQNKKKLAELSRILAPLGFSVITQDEAGISDAAEETGTTFAENAYLKAAFVAARTGKICVADDSGLCVDALGGEPGVYSARYSGEPVDDARNIRKLLGALEGIPEEKRTAHFVSAVCMIFPDGSRIEAEGRCTGRIGFAPRGTGGFGYDPDFFMGERSLAEFTPAEKDAVSHRGASLRKLAELLAERAKEN